MDPLRNSALEVRPSMFIADIGRDREDRAIVANVFAYIGASEYCGLAAIWLKSRARICLHGLLRQRLTHEALANQWCTHIAKRFTGLFGDYELVARASNGEAFYRKIEGQGKGS